MDHVTAPKIPMTAINGLTTDDLMWIAHWCALKRETFPEFSPWLLKTAADEAERRQSQGAIEAGDIDSPEFNPKLLACALPAVYTLARQALTATLAGFIDELDRHVIAASSAMLSELAEQGVNA